MTTVGVPWIELAIATTLIGSLWISQVRQPHRAARLGLFFTGLAFAFTFLAWLEFYLGADSPGTIAAWSASFGLDGMLQLDHRRVRDHRQQRAARTVAARDESTLDSHRFAARVSNGRHDHVVFVLLDL